MKPDWKDAPEWAKWIAQDPNGEWFWYQKEPFFSDGVWNPNDGLAIWAGESEFEMTPERRP